MPVSARRSSLCGFFFRGREAACSRGDASPLANEFGGEREYCWMREKVRQVEGLDGFMVD